MKLTQVKPHESSEEDDESEVFEGVDEAEVSEGEEEAEEDEAEAYQDEMDVEEAAYGSSVSASELKNSDNLMANPHPYPTPPPEGPKTFSNGMQKATKESTAPKNKMAAIKVKPNSILGQSMAAIEALATRGGSSVPAIVKYMKSKDSEITDERRMGKLVLKALKIGIANGSVEQVKRSFKITQQAKQASKAMEKMKVKQQQKAKALDKENLMKQGKKAEKNELKNNVKATERKTKQPVKKKPANANVQPKAKAAAGAAAQAALEKLTENVEPAKKAGKKNAAKESSNPSAEAPKKAKTKSKSKANLPRKSIGTLAQPKVAAKASRKTVKKLVAGKDIAKNISGININPNESPMKSSTPVANNKRKGRPVKSQQK